MAELKEKFGADKVQAELIVGEAGIFNVDFDGERIFTKKEIGRFPIYGEIPMAIQMKMLDA